MSYLCTRSTTLKLSNALVKPPYIFKAIAQLLLQTHIESINLEWRKSALPLLPAIASLMVLVCVPRPINHHFQPDSLITQELVHLLVVESITRSSSKLVQSVF